MNTAGIDIGSRTIKLVEMQDGEMTGTWIEDNSIDPMRVCRDLLEGVSYDFIVATGYGRRLFSSQFSSDTISEIKAFALGARAIAPECRAVLDMGGQDTKAISLDRDGRLRRFEMNDKCAAGTGRFLEIMATALGYTLDDFGRTACRAVRHEKINSMCTVFAESEVVSLVARGARADEVALGLHEAIAERAVAMLLRINAEPGILFVGGVAHNPCMIRCLEKRVASLSVPADPQIVGALGCALHAAATHCAPAYKSSAAAITRPGKRDSL